MSKQKLNLGSKMEGEKRKVRKRGFSSSSPSTQNYRLKRTFLMGKRRGSTTPVPTWKMIDSQSQSQSQSQSHSKSQSQSQSLQNDRNQFMYLNGANAKDLSVSARKLAALLWEIDGRMMPSPILNMEILGDKKTEAGIAGKHRILESSKLRSMEIGLSHPSLTTVSEGILDPTKLCSSRRRSLAGCRKPPRQVDGEQNHAKGQIHGLNNNLKDVYDGLTTSKQLLDVLSRVRGLEQPECISSMLVSALGAELDRSCNRVSKLIQGQKREKSEPDVLLKQITHNIHHVVPSVVEELETEKKLRRRCEKLNKKTGAELAETREYLERAIKELESEKKARRKVEQVCEELARGVWELKRQFGKVREEVEKEREMFHIADLLREERVQMKLSDAQFLYEEKNSLVDKLRNELEASLKGDGKSKEVEKLLSHSHQNQENDGAANQVEEESSDDSDLHSIELSIEEMSKSFKWGYAVKNGSNFDTSKGRIPKKQPFTQNQKLQMTLLSECSTK